MPVSRIIDIARRCAETSPEVTLACPVCGVLLKGKSLERHLGKVHPGQDDAGTAWRGKDWRGGSLAWHEGVLQWRGRWGPWGRRHRELGKIERAVIGSTRRAFMDWTTAPYDSGDYATKPDERTGRYITLHGDGPPITVRCLDGGETVRKAWLDWEQGPQLASWQITVAPGAFVALSYLLADAEVLRFRTA